jgi:hypothetical protein
MFPVARIIERVQQIVALAPECIALLQEEGDAIRRPGRHGRGGAGRHSNEF